MNSQKQAQSDQGVGDLKSPDPKGHVGSIPTPGTTTAH